MAGEAERHLNSAAGLLFESARSLGQVSERLESIAETQAAATDRLVDALEKMGSGKPGSSGSKKDSGFKTFSKDVTELVKAIAKYEKVQAAGDKLVGFLKEFDKINFKKMTEGGNALKSMASGLAAFSLALVASGALLAIAAVASIIIVPMIAGYAYLFYQLGKAGKEIQEGAKSIGWMGLALVGFAAGIFAVKMLAGGDWGEFAKGSLIVLAGIAAFTGAFYLVGKVAEPVEKGAKALAWSGLALLSLALGIASFQYLKVDFGSVLIAAGAVALTGLAFALIGEAAIYIEEGALALAIAGASLAILALGLASFRLLHMDFEEAVRTAGIVGIVGGMFAAVGLASLFIAAGAVSMLVAGVALIALAGGLAVMNAMYSKAMGGLLAPNSADPKQTNLDVVIGSVANAFNINPVKSAFMLVGAAALIVASVALITLAGGVLAFNFAYNKAKDGVLAPSDQDPTMSNMDVAVTGIVNAFYINPVKSAFMLVGAAALIVASVALITLTGGVLAFNFAYNKTKDGGLFAPSAMDPKITNFENTLNALAGGMVLGPLRLVGLYAAIPAWIAAGVALLTIGGGVAGFAELVEQKIDITKIDGMITKVLTTVLDVFTGVGDGKLVDWDSVEEGISSVSDVGNLLNGIAQGVSKMADLKFPVYDKDGNITSYFTVGDDAFSKVAANMKLIISAVAGTLVDIGKTSGETGWFSKSAGEKGADAIRGIGQDLVGIADFVQKAANLTFPTYDKDGKQTGVVTLDPGMLAKGGSVYTNIVSMIQAVSGALADIGSGESASSGWFSDSDIEKGKAAIAGVSADLNGIAQMVQSVSQIQDIGKTEKNIKRILMAIPEALVAAGSFLTKNRASLGNPIQAAGSFGDLLDKMKDSVDPVDKLAKSFESISKSMKSVSSDSKELYKFVYEKSAPKEQEKPATKPTPSNAVTELPGEKKVAPAKPSKRDEQQQELMTQLSQMYSDMATQMSNLAGSMKRIEAVLSGTLKVRTE